ncbi:Glycosyltransferase involved in cell wall bisynthesis [Methylobacterium phyllostachyos]|uniref:Glycosyltransferase involved in cell wall bisynthesis n=1 Tax=Methylobacterium phyllostachyos TaxID=582672 RepID=A0A1H0IK28_9HYPH|nr:glycosyltransferase [Methylobacterium phyllostachyos]SDO31696.1 Glycosyltransferase involved in cell wall bisynthesis [Methylobacterium phyllostachyos]
MRVAIVHDWLYVVGGAERVLEQLLRIYPDADVFALFDFLPEADRARIGYAKARTSFLQKMPFARTRHRVYLPLMPIAIEQFDLSAYDLIVSSSYAVAKGVLTGPDQLHVSYVHSPMRYAWDLQHTYLRESGCDTGLKGVLARVVLHRMRLWDVRTASGPNAIAANSAFVARRIRKVYGRTAEVIHPPITLSSQHYDGPRGNHFLVASRLVPYKNVEAVVRAFALLPDLQLVVAGSGPDAARLREIAGPNVSFVGFVSDEGLRQLMATARAFIFAAEEDFGIIVVEASAEGTPVLALGRGGARETVQVRGPQRSGMFFDRPEPEPIADCVRGFIQQEQNFTREACRAQADLFSAELFRKRFSRFVDEQMALHRAACEPRTRVLPRLEAVG